MQLDDSGSEAAKWDAYVRSHPDGTFFHLSGWRRVAADALGHTPRYLATQESGAITGLLPLTEIKSSLFGHSLISTAFCVGGGPLWSNDGALSQLLHEGEEQARALGASYIELRDTQATAREWIGRSDLYAGFAGPIAADEAENLKQIPRKQRAVVRKTLTAEFTVSIDNAIDPFFQLYARNMRDHGTPALPRRFFSAVLKTFGTDCEILTVHLDGRPVSSVLSYFFRDRVLPYYTGSMPEARATGANDHMYWSLMRRAVERGCSTFDFGRSKVGTGPYNFKRNWGFEPRPITHQYRMLDGQALPNINPTNPRYALFIRAWQKLPLPVANLISPLLSRNLG